MLNRMLWVMAILLIAGIAVRAETPTTKLTVEVKNLEGKPVDRASVVVRFVEGKTLKVVKKSVTYEMRTDQDGVARVPEIPRGKIRIQVIAKNYQTFGQIFDVDQDEKTIEIKLNPPQAQFSAHQ
jgi:hypothetical protein